jgi:hypothetical protein
MIYFIISKSFIYFKVKPMNLDFVCIGGTKCGTTWLSQMLTANPEINVSVNKEPCYFSGNYHKGAKWYAKNWAKKAGKKGEFTAHYLYNKQAINRLKDDYPDVKIIVLLREPISRSISHYQMISRGKKFNDNALLKDLDTDIFDRSEYYSSLTFLFKVFPMEQILVEYYDSIIKNPKKLLEKIYRFLELESIIFPKNINQWYGKAHNPQFIILYKPIQLIHDYLSKKQSYKLIFWIKKMKLPNLYKWLVPKRKVINKNHVALIKGQKKRLYSDLNKIASVELDFNKSVIKKWLSLDSDIGK